MCKTIGTSGSRVSGTSQVPWLGVALAGLFSLLVACSVTEEEPLGGEAWVGGIQVNEPDSDGWIAALERHDLNAVALTVYARQADWRSADIHSDTPLEWLVPEIRAAKSRGLRVVLVLRVALDHAHDVNEFLWHGMIAPSESAEEEWFARYEAFVVRWALLAEQEGVDLLGIGSELSALTSTTVVERLPELEEYFLNDQKQATERKRIESAVSAEERSLGPAELSAGWNREYEDVARFLDGRTRAQREWALAVTAEGDLERFNHRRSRWDARWRAVIDAARAVYGGLLTYAANFDQYEQVGFWDALDVIGINAYFPLSASFVDPARRQAVFRGAWERNLAALDDLRESLDRPTMPVLFTEIGYARWRGATIEPWAGAGFGVVGDRDLEGRPNGRSAELVLWKQQPLDPSERVAAFAALYDVAGRFDPPLLLGALYWKLSTVPSHSGFEPFLLYVGLGADDPLLEGLRELRGLPAHPTWVEPTELTD